MQPIKILIADDELLAREAIKLALPTGYRGQVVAACSDGHSALEAILLHLPDIIFIDIQMPGLSGFEVLNALPESYQPYLIMVTAHDQYALKAFEYHAADYLLKPFNEERFSNAFKRALQSVNRSETLHEVASLKTLVDRLNVIVPAKSFKTRLSVKDGTRIFVVPTESIRFIEAAGDYVSLHTTEKKYLHAETLNSLEAVLDPSVFVRIHRSCLVNTSCIKELQSLYNGDYHIILNDGHTLKLSRNYREQLMQVIG